MPIPPSAETVTTPQGGIFRAIGKTKQARASLKSRMSPMAPVKTGEWSAAQNTDEGSVRAQYQ